jgi:hypothetical protein
MLKMALEASVQYKHLLQIDWIWHKLSEHSEQTVLHNIHSKLNSTDTKFPQIPERTSTRPKGTPYILAGLRQAAALQDRRP